MAQASLQQPAIKFVLPYGPEKRENIEIELAKKLATGKLVEGGIFLTSTFNRFAYIRSEGDTEIPLRDQFPLLKSQDKDLGTKRRETRTIYFVKDSRGVDARLFVRVIAGCSQVQIDGAVQYLNERLDGPNNTFPGVCEQYDLLIPFCRDILYPDFRYFTRRKRLSPWMWQPVVWPPTGCTVSLSHVIHNGSETTPVAVQTLQENYRWPEVTLVRRADTNTIHDLKELSKVVPEDAILADSTGQLPAPQETSAPNPSEPDLVVQSEVVVDTSKGLDGDSATDMVTDQNEADNVPADTEAQGKAQDKVGDNHEISEKMSESGDSDAIEEINMESDAEDEAKSVANSIDDDADNDVVDNVEPEKADATEENKTPEKSDIVVGAKTTDKSDRDGPLPDYNDEEEEILSGYMDTAKKTTRDKVDERPVTLRRLHMALPKSKSAIPDGLKKRLPFSMLVLNIRHLENEYNEEMGIDNDLPDIDEGKTLNQREVKREMKHLLELMSQRDKWESDMRVTQARAVVEKKHKKMTKAQRKLEAEKLEAREQERLAAKERLANGIPEDLQELPVENGPGYKGLGGFALYRRQGVQRRENERRQRERDRLFDLVNSTVEKDHSIASSTGSVKPLSRVLNKQAQKKSKAQAKAHKKASSLTDDQLRQEMDDISQMLDMAKSDDAVGNDDEGHRPSTSKEANKKSNDDSLFVKPQLPKGYVKADTLKLMKAMYVQQSQLITSNTKQFGEFAAQLKSLDARQKRTEAMLERTGADFGKMQKAFFDYDLQANQELCDIESEFLAYFPVDQLGARTDFVFSDPSCAKTIVKKIIRNMQKEGTKRHTFSNLINESARVCFSLGLRAHMHIVKRQWKESVGWWKVRCPESFRKMIEKYVIPYGAKYNLKESKEGWRTIMYTHFKNTGDTYIQNICAGVKSQTDFIARRHEERIRLQQRHYNEDIEGRELRVPTLSKELASYAKHSDRFEDADDMVAAEKSQKGRSSQGDSESEGEKEKVVPPLPNLTALHDIAKRLKKAIDASICAGKEQKRKIAVDNLVSAEASQDSAEDDDESPPPSKKAKVNKKKRKEKRKKGKSGVPESSSSSNNSSSASSSSSSSSDGSDDDSSESGKEASAFKPNSSKFNLETTLNRTSSKAAASTPKKQPPSMGKPKAYASFAAHPPKKGKLSHKKK